MNKKIMLSSLLIVLFAVYVLYQHNGLAVPTTDLRKTNLQSPAFMNSPPPATATPPQNPAPVQNPQPAPPAQPTANLQTPPASVPQPTQAPPQQKYKDGQYTGSVQDAYYGSVQVQATIQNGQITTVNFLQYPNTHSTSVYINSQAMPMLQSEAIQAQSAQVDIISGATFTSQAYQASLSDALSQATG